jgi:DNA-binding protein Fis
MVVMAPTKDITPDLLPMSIMAYDPHHDSDSPSAKNSHAVSFEARISSYMQTETHACLQRDSTDLYDIVRSKWERYLFEAVLNACNNNKSKAAQVLGITRNTLNTRLKELCNMKLQWTVE